LEETKNSDELELKEAVVSVSRVSKVVKGGKRFGFNAIVVVGDGRSCVGWGMGKAREVPEAIKKATSKAKKNLIRVNVINGTIPHEVYKKYCSAEILIKPASPGTGIIAGGCVRAIMELSGIKNILTKSMRSHNPHNLVKATFDALESLKLPEDVARIRGKDVKEIPFRGKEQSG